MVSASIASAASTSATSHTRSRCTSESRPAVAKKLAYATISACHHARLAETAAYAVQNAPAATNPMSVP